MRADRPAVLEDLGRLGVLLLRQVADLLEQREVDVGLDVARRAGVAVPVPGATEVATLFDHPDVVDAALAQSGCSEQTAESPADDGDVDGVVQRRTFDTLDVRVVEVMGELPGDLDVLLVAVGPEPTVALVAVLLAEGIGIESELWHVRGLVGDGVPVRVERQHHRRLVTTGRAIRHAIRHEISHAMERAIERH